MAKTHLFLYRNDENFDLDSPGNDLSVLVGTNDLYLGGQRKMIDRVFVHPSYTHKYVTYGKFFT